jgi:hypothetical protein
MKSKLHLGRGVAILACAASLAGTAVAVAPTAASARAASSCANKSLALKTEGRVLHFPVKAVTVQGGVSCTTAYKVITGVLEGKIPSGWKSAVAHFEPPEGLVAQMLTKGSKTIKYAVQGG